MKCLIFLPKQKIFVTYLFCGLLFCSCTSLQFKGLFTDYTEQMQQVRHAQLAGEFEKAQSIIEDLDVNENKDTLMLLEKGRLNFLANDWQKSREEFALAADLLDKEALKAKIRVSKGIANVGSLVSNDNVLAYEVPVYERSMLHTYQALNYVFLGELEGALVEIRRANLIQERALKVPQSQPEDSEYKFETEAIKERYPSMAATIGQVSNAFQNAYTFYLSGVLYEASSQDNDAYIDYKRALAIYPDNHFLQQDVLRLATKLHMDDDLTALTSIYGSYQAKKQTGYGDVVVIIEQGIVQEKQEFAVDLPVFSRSKDRYFSFALPIYQGDLVERGPVTLKAAGVEISSQPIVHIQSLASKDLQTKLPELVIRQILRLAAKEKLRSTMEIKGGDVGNILATLYNIVSEHADTRSWSSLPDEVQILRLSLPSGAQQLQFKYRGVVDNVQLNVRENRISLIHLTTIGEYQGHKVTNL